MWKETEMDYLAPPLNAVLQIELKIKNNSSVRSAIQYYIKNFPDCVFARQMSLWLLCIETGKPFTDSTLNRKSWRKALLDIIHRGLKGEPILHLLQEFEGELKEVALQDLEQQVQKLPFLSLIPLFLFQVPAFFLLLLAPLILELQSSFYF